MKSYDSYLVTGAMGFIGSHWCEYLLRKGKKVIGLDMALHYEKLLEYDNFVFLQDTIKNVEILGAAVSRVDCICHFAGIATPVQYVKTPRKVIDVTAVAGIEFIELCRLSGKLFFFASTSEVYGKNTKIPFKEDADRVLGATTTKRWCYATSKAILEHYLDACAFSKELEYVTVRLFNVYGPRLRGRVVSHFVDAAIKNEDLIVHGDGKQTRCFTFIDDVIDAFDLLIHDPECYNQIFNVGNPKETSIGELATIVKNIGDAQSNIRSIPHLEYYGSGYEDIYRRVPDVSKIKQYTGWEPVTSLEEGIAKTIQHGKSAVKDAALDS